MASENGVAATLKRAGAVFAFVHGSRAEPGAATPSSDLDIAAWWGTGAPDPWALDLPDDVDLLVLDSAPLWLAGRVAMHGRLLFEQDAADRVRWQVDTRMRYVDELPALRERYAARRRQLASRGAQADG